MDVVAARAHLAVTGGVDVEHLRWFAGDGVQPEVAALLLAVPPLLETLFVRHHPRGEVAKGDGHVGGEHASGFRDVVVDTDEDHVVCLHRAP